MADSPSAEENTDMELVRPIRSAIMRRIANPARRERHRVQAEAARQRQQRPHTVLYFHQVDDPYSQLAAQAIAPLLARYDIRLEVKLVAHATPIAIHEQALWDQWAARECAAMAPAYGLRFELPAAGADLSLARRLLLGCTEAREFADQAAAVSHALHLGTPALQALAAGRSLPTSADAEVRLAAHFALRHRLGHYLGAMFCYEGEWYWGIDRLHYLEARLDGLGARRSNAPAGPSVSRRPLPALPPVPGRRLTLEFFPSLRSPYTHLSYGRVAALVARYPIDLVLRPVLPMMMRGVKADRRKGVYILQDTQREAERLGIPFGNLWDPFGKPILRAYSLFPWAQAQGRGFEYLHVYSQAVWSERVDAWSLTGLRQIVERAGLRWSEALAHLEDRKSTRLNSSHRYISRMPSSA
jgi:2-hydroxychromene-2-carboxylate isomerase